jgi:hypothetical protein
LREQNLGEFLGIPAFPQNLPGCDFARLRCASAGRLWTSSSFLSEDRFSMKRFASADEDVGDKKW